MGCDIHIYAEKLENGKWKKLSLKIPDNRNYWSFALMANVRNGYGFAGCQMGDEVAYISEPRGLPEDTSIKESGEEVDYEDPNYVWLGDHSFSHLLLSELMALDLKRKHKKTGFVTKEEFALCEKEKRNPSEWCRGTNNPTYIKMEWEDELEKSAFLIPEIIDSLKSYGDPEKIRLVFGFDN